MKQLIYLLLLFLLIPSISHAGYYGAAGRRPVVLANLSITNSTFANTTKGIEVIVNGDMELDANWINNSTPITNVRSNEQAHGGTYSRKWTANNAADGINQQITLTGGITYKILSSIYGDNTNYAMVVLYRGAYKSFSPLSVTTTGYVFPASWSNETWYYTADATSVSWYLIACVGLSESAGTFYLDDVSVKPVTIDSWTISALYWNPSTDGTTLTGKARKTAGVASDLTQDLTTQIDDIYGYRLDLTTADRTGGNLIVDIGGTNSSAITTNAAQIIWLNGGAVDTNLRFEADATYDGSVDALTLYKLTNSPPTDTAVWIR